jgi:hypothetical protein
MKQDTKTIVLKKDKYEVYLDEKGREVHDITFVANTVDDCDHDLEFAQHVWDELKTLPIILPIGWTTAGKAYEKLQEFISDRDIDSEKQEKINDCFDKFEGAVVDLEDALESAGVRRGGK